MTGPYDQGQTLELSAIITDPDTNALVTPSTVVFKVYALGGIVQTPTVINPSTGVYTAEVTLSVGGQWFYRVDTTGPTGGAERSFSVTPSQIPGA